MKNLKSDSINTLRNLKRREDGKDGIHELLLNIGVGRIGMNFEVFTLRGIRPSVRQKLKVDCY